MPYDYFYNGEAEQYIHYTLPKLFFKEVKDKETNVHENEELTGLSLNAKFLYSILLDKAKLSDKNGFTDEDGKVCVYYPQAKMAKLLHVERKQLYKYLNELDVKSGIGLIERRQKLGKGRTDCIYVKNFAKPIRDGVTPPQTSNTKYKYFCDDDTASAARFNYYSLPKALFYDVDYATKYTYPDEILELQKLPSNAKMAYTYFLYLLSLSISKGKKDEYGRYFVICPEEDLKKLLGCCIQTVRQILNQLDINGGVGLIERSTDNPAIIYVLDYSARLKLSCKSKGKKNTHQNEKSTHQDEESTHQESEKSTHQDKKSTHQDKKSTHQDKKSTHQDKKSTHQDKKSTHQNKKSTHPIYINPYLSNPDFSDNHSINPSCDNADRLTDGTQYTKKEMSFSEILKAIDYPDIGDKNTSEEEFELHFKDIDESNREIDKCTLPYWLKENQQAMREALKFVFSYSNYQSDDDNEIRRLLETIIKSLVEMTKNDYCILDKQTVKYYQIIDIINDIMHNSSLMCWLYSFKDEWSQILSERDIKRPEAYIKTCIWNSLSNFQFKNNNDALQGEYDCKHNIRKTQEEQGVPTDTNSSHAPEEFQHKHSDDVIIRFFLTAALKNNEPLKCYLNNYSHPLPNGLTLDSPFDLTDEKLRELEVKYAVSLVSLRVKEESFDDSNDCDLEALNESPALPESIQTIEQSGQLPESQPEAAGTETGSEAENIHFRYSDSFIVRKLLLCAMESNRTLSEYLENYQYPLPDGLTFDSPNDLTEENLKELEVMYDVRLRK